jgi:hypothetical protein
LSGGINLQGKIKAYFFNLKCWDGPECMLLKKCLVLAIIQMICNETGRKINNVGGVGGACGGARRSLFARMELCGIDGFML